MLTERKMHVQKKPHALTGRPKTEAHKQAMRHPKSDTSNMTGGFKIKKPCPYCGQSVMMVKFKRHIEAKHAEVQIQT